MRRAALRVACASLGLVAAGTACAQARNPFGVGISEGGGSPVGLTGWLLAQQGWFEHQLSAGVRAVRTDSAAFWWLLGIGFLYGVVHAAGPGHGKAVLASYMVANERALRRGLVLSFLAALLQGLVAIALVGILSLVLHATAQRMKDVASLVEVASFAGVACLGAWLVWRKGSSFVRLWRLRPGRSAVGRATGGGSWQLAVSPMSAASDGHFAFAAVASPEASRFVCAPADASHGRDCLCHGLDPATLAGERLSWREAGLTVLAAGSRPCSGAILVLVFALVQGVFPAGICSVLAMSLGVAITTGALASVAVLAKSVAQRLATPGSRTRALVVSGLELASAFAVLLAGSALLLGYSVAG